MDPTDALERLGGVADAASLLCLTSRGRLRAAVRRGSVVRDARGRYALDGVDEAVRRAVALSGVLVGLSAARVHGWELAHQPDRPEVAVPRHRNVPPSRRRGVRLRYVDLDPDDVSGPALRPVATVLDCASRLRFPDALAVADSALRRLEVRQDELVDRAGSLPPRYRARASRVAREASPLAANPFESTARAIALDVPGLHLRPQVPIEGVGRPDLVDVERRLVVEADSFAFHGHRRALDADCRRYNALVVRGWTVVRFSWEQVMLEPGYVHDVLSALVEPSGRALGQPLRRRTA